MEIAAEILTAKEVSQMIGLSRTSIWRRERAGDFPRRRILGSNRVGWVRGEVAEWVRNRPVVTSDTQD